MRNVVIVHYNTPELTDAAIRSLNKHTPGCQVYILDNSDSRPFVNSFQNVEVIDNTKGQHIDFDKWLDTFPDKEPPLGNHYGSAKHCYSVDYMTDYLEKPFVLMDSDILVTQDISTFFDESYVFAGRIHCNTKRFGITVYRLAPFLCFLNVPMMRKHGVRYFNRDWMWTMSHVYPNNRYDTGAWFLKDCWDKNLPSKDIDIGQYIKHFVNGSWVKRDFHRWLRENRMYWQ